MTAGPITDYLRVLRRELRMPRAEADAVVLEVRDHLMAASEELAAKGLSAVECERTAVERFGDPLVLGQAMTAHAVRADALAAARTAVAAVACTAAVYVGYKSLMVLPTGQPPEMPDAVLLHSASVAFQVTIVAAIVGLYKAATSGQVAAAAQVARCSRISSAAMGLAVALTASYEVRRVDANSWQLGAAPVLGVVLAAMFAAFLIAFNRQRRLIARIRSTAGNAAVAYEMGPTASRPERACMWLASLLADPRRLSTPLRALDFQRYPARLTTLVAAASAATIYLGSRAVGDETVATAAVGAAIEASGVIFGAVVLAPKLGICGMREPKGDCASE
jgi:hypothetical protein